MHLALALAKIKIIMKKNKRSAVVLGALVASSLLVGCSDSSETSALDWSLFVDAQLVEFSVSDTPCTFSQKSVELLVTLRNSTDQKIIDIEAAALVNDLEGNEITELNLVGGGSFGPTEELKVGSWGELCYDMDHSPERAKQLLELEDLGANTDVVIKVKKITFEDGKILEF